MARIPSTLRTTFGITCGIFCLFGSASAETLTAASINAKIVSVVKAGGTSYTLPAGQILLDAPITVPAGTSNFTISGAGVGKTTLVANAALTSLISVGNARVTYPSNAEMARLPNVNVQSVAAGATIIKTAAPVVPGDYVLYDDGGIKMVGFSNVIQNHGEIVHVISSDATGTRLTVGTGREYSGTVHLANVADQLAKNITISDLTLAPGNTANPPDYLVDARLVSGLKMLRMAGSGFEIRGFHATLSENVLMQDLQVSNPYSITSGEGYGVVASKCRWVTISRITGAECRYTAMLHSGTMDATIDTINGTSSVGFGGVDTHGTDERRVTVHNAHVPKISIGNDTWRGGAKDVLVDTSNPTIVTVSPGVDRAIFRGLTTTFLSITPDVANDGPKVATGTVRFESCTFNYAGRIVYQTELAPSSLYFSACNFNTTLTTVPLFEFTAGNGTLTLDGCISSNNLDVAAVQAEAAAPNVGITVKNSTFRSTRTMPSVLGLVASYKGLVSTSGITATNKKGSVPPIASIGEVLSTPVKK